VARGGQATVENVRLRCRAHNQYAAECTFGKDFMETKWDEARRAAQARARAVAADARAQATARERAQDVIPYLRRLGFRSDESRRAAALGATLPDAPLEERVRLALTYFHPPARVHAPAPPGHC